MNNIKLMQGDCLELMKDIPDKSIDMILCDLPYGKTRNKWDNIIPLETLWGGYNRVIKDNGAIVLFADGMFMVDLMRSNEKYWRYNLIWDKKKGCDFLNANVKPLKSHEEILIFYKKKPVYNKQFWYSIPYKKTKNSSLSNNYGYRGIAYSQSDDGKRNPLSILSFARDVDRLHPTQKPVALLEYLIKTYTNENDLVLDNCAGSMSTAIACLNTNRDCIMIEKDNEYFKIGRNRVENHIKENSVKTNMYII